MSFSLKLNGLHALQAQLVDLGAELAQKALAQAARKAFKPVLEAAKSLVAVGEGEMRDALRITVKKPRGGEAVVVVGLRIGGKAAPGKIPPARRWHFLEFGTAHMAAHPFLRNAIDQNAEAVLAILKTELAKSITRAAKKKAKAAAR